MRRNKKEKSKNNVISFIMYAVSVIFAIISIFAAYSISYDYSSKTGRLKGYTMTNLDSDFQSGNYASLENKIAYNKAVGRQITDNDRDYYTFTDYYNSVVEANVCLANGDSAGADAANARCDEYYNSLVHKIFRERADILREKLDKKPVVYTEALDYN